MVKREPKHPDVAKAKYVLPYASGSEAWIPDPSGQRLLGVVDVWGTKYITISAGRDGSGATMYAFPFADQYEFVE